MLPKNNAGFFITFEGGDGAGKTTLLEGVFSYLESKSFPVMKTKAPGGTPLGMEIRSLLLEKRAYRVESLSELFLFLADRSEHTQKVLKPALSENKIILCDRFSDSTIAYQAGARHLGESLVRSLCEIATSHLQPHLTFYLDIDPKIGLERARKNRGSHDRIEQETLSFHEKIRSVFLELQAQEPKRMILLDACLSKEQLLKQAVQKIDALLLTPHR